MIDEEATDHFSDQFPIERRRTPRKTLMIEITDELHQRIIDICLVRGIPVNEAVREVLSRSFTGADEAAKELQVVR